jgi:hypothetical protein
MLNKKSKKIIIDNNKSKSKNINKLVKLTLSYIDKLNLAESVIPAKLKYAEQGKYEKACVERKKELKYISEANVIFKKMNKLSKLIS